MAFIAARGKTTLIYGALPCNTLFHSGAWWCNLIKANPPESRLRQLDATLARWRRADLPQRPPSGWIKAIREGLARTRALVDALRAGSRRTLWNTGPGR